MAGRVGMPFTDITSAALRVAAGSAAVPAARLADANPA
jgi:hypothetical protein